MKLIEVTMCYPKYGREPKDEGEVCLKKAFFISQNIISIIEETEKPMVKTIVHLAGGVSLYVTDTVEDLREKIDHALKEEFK